MTYTTKFLLSWMTVNKISLGLAALAGFSILLVAMVYLRFFGAPQVKKWLMGKPRPSKYWDRD